MQDEIFRSEFHQLSENRIELLRALDKNNFKILELLAGIYPDEAHFVYELLQNAEDSDANEVTFYLSKTGLIFQHNGKKKFTIKDIDAITSINNSTKTQDQNKIGKFGVGFKSVYAFCSKPIINSAGFTFEIEQGFLPKANEKSELQFDIELTTFILNFNEVTKPPQIAWSQINVGLLELDQKSLLFLTNIKCINIHITGDSTLKKKIQRIDVNPNLVEFNLESNNEINKKTYYILKDKLPDISINEIDESALGKFKDFKIAVAFEASKDADGNIKIIPAEKGEVNVYFPAVKENSGLKFHIHAPFASTPSRDVIADTLENGIFLKGLADLLSSNISYFKANNLLNEGLLSAFPNATDRLPSAYEIFRLKIYEVFNGSEFLIPTSGDTFSNIDTAISASQITQESVETKLMNSIVSSRNDLNSGKYRYVRLFKEQRANQFLSTLRTRNLGIAEIRKLLSQKNDSDKILNFINALKNLNILHYRKFISLFSQQTNEIALDFRHIPLIYIGGKDEEWSVASEVFLPTQDFTGGAKIVSKSLFDRSNPNTDGLDTNIERSLFNLGVRLLDNWALLDLDLEKISKLHKFGDPVDQTKLEEIKVDFEKIGRAVGIDKERIKKLSKLNIIIGYDSNESLVWTSFDRSFIDAPFRNTGLNSVRSILEEGQSLTRIWEGYATFPRIELFLENTNILLGLKPEKSIASNNSSNWSIPKLDRMLEIGDLDFSLMIWKLLIDFSNEKFRWHEASRRSGRTWVTEHSDFINTLRYVQWIPDLEEKKYRPSQMNTSRLHQRFSYKDTELIHAINFDGDSKEAQAKKRAEERLRAEKNSMAKELGFTDYEEVEQLQKLKAKNPELLKDLILSLQSVFPEELVEDLDKSILETTKALGDASHVRFVENVIRERKNYSVNHVAMKNYVRSKYDLGDVMKCQACSFIMPFKLKSGEFYFEAVFAFKEIPKNVLENVLALCPTCAAKYKYARDTSNLELVQRIKNSQILGTGAVSVPLKMANVDCQLTFTEEHILALQTILKNTFS